jgi:hypothetical protein
MEISNTTLTAADVGRIIGQVSAAEDRYWGGHSQYSGERSVRGWCRTALCELSAHLLCWQKRSEFVCR